MQKELKPADTQTSDDTRRQGGKPFTMSDVTIPLDVLNLILYRYWSFLRHSESALWQDKGNDERHKVLNSWGMLRFVCTTFNHIVTQVENQLDSEDSKDKWCFYNDVNFQDASPLLEPEKSLDHNFLLKSSEDIIAVVQLGNQPNHYWAPLLTCNSLFELCLFSTPPKPEQPLSKLQVSSPSSYRYTEHKAKLTAAISLSEVIISGDELGCVGIWSDKNARKFRFFKAHDQKVTAIDYVNSEKFVTAGDTTAKCWSFQSSEPLLVFEAGAPIKDLRAKSSDEWLLLTLNATHEMNIVLYSNGQTTKKFSIQFDTIKHNFMMADYIRLLSPTRIVGIMNKPVNSFDILDFSKVDHPEVKSVVLDQPFRTNFVFLSRGNYCSFLIKSGSNNRAVKLHIEEAKTGCLAPSNNW